MLKKLLLTTLSVKPKWIKKLLICQVRIELKFYVLILKLIHNVTVVFWINLTVVYGNKDVNFFVHVLTEKLINNELWKHRCFTSSCGKEHHFFLYLFVHLTCVNCVFYFLDVFILTVFKFSVLGKFNKSLNFWLQLYCFFFDRLTTFFTAGLT